MLFSAFSRSHSRLLVTYWQWCYPQKQSSAFLGWPPTKTGVFSCNSKQVTWQLSILALTLFRGCCLFPFSLFFASWKNGHNPKSLLSAKLILKENIISHFLTTLSSLQHHIKDPKKKRGSATGLIRKAEEERQSKLYGQYEKTWVYGVLPSGLVPSPAFCSAKSWSRAKQQTMAMAALVCCMQHPSPSLFFTFSLSEWLCFHGPGNAVFLAFSGVAAEQVCTSSWGREESWCCHSHVAAKGVGQQSLAGLMAWKWKRTGDVQLMAAICESLLSAWKGKSRVRKTIVLLYCFPRVSWVPEFLWHD